MIDIRAATEADVPLLLTLIRELATYERLADQVTATEDDLRRTLFGERPAAEALLATWDGQPAGMAIFFPNYSTFLARPGLYLEDLFVRPNLRRRGIGRALFVRLAKLAVERGCGRFEWAVLDWNAPAVAFYRSLSAIPMSEWTVFRLTGDALVRASR